MPDIDPETITDPIDYFNLMKTNVLTNSGQDKDRFHYARDTEKYKQYAESGVSAGYGFTVSLIQEGPSRRATIVYSEPNSQAALKGIKRGTEIISVDGVAIANGDPDLINARLAPSTLGEAYPFVIRDLNALSERTVILESTSVTKVPVHTAKIITSNERKVGYLLLNSFGIATAEQQLIDVINTFKNKQINELVLDLRYNGGGYLAISAELGTMIAGNTSLGKVFTELAYNDKRRMENEYYSFPMSSFGIEKPAISGILLPQLSLPRVYIISTNNTASASEYLINGLRGVNVEVILMGTATTGKPYGFLPEENCGTTYFTVQFKGQNSQGFGDFADGFIPSGTDNGQEQVRGCSVLDDLTHPLGDINEKMLATALYHIKNDSCPTNTLGLNSKSSHPLSSLRGKVLRTDTTGLIKQN